MHSINYRTARMFFSEVRSGYNPHILEQALLLSQSSFSLAQAVQPVGLGSWNISKTGLHSEENGFNANLQSCKHFPGNKIF